MKKSARLLVVLMLLCVGSTSVIASADGPGIPPTGNPFGGVLADGPGIPPTGNPFGGVTAVSLADGPGIPPTGNPFGDAVKLADGSGVFSNLQSVEQNVHLDW